MKVVLLRHAETVLNASGRFCGRTDCNITERGKKITAQLANAEPFTFGFTAMFVSPLKRTVQTLEAIYPEGKFKVDSRLIEISLGSWEGLEKTSVDQSKRKAFLKGLYNPPNAEETHEDVVKRIKSFFEELNMCYGDNDIILVVTHNGVLRTIKQILNMPEEKMANSSFVVIESKDIIK